MDRPPLPEGLNEIDRPGHRIDDLFVYRRFNYGSYGMVYRLENRGVTYAGKIPIVKENVDAQHLVAIHYNECRILSKLNHQNIVRFMGICFPSTISPYPVLVMELLLGSLDEILDDIQDIDFSTKVSILLDVANGLEYLHYQNPPIIHRDLCAQNILLNRDTEAKIADFGTARVLDIQQDQLHQPMSPGVPGTQPYMPPEAFIPNPEYGCPLDIFSFGHLSLYVAIQQAPENLLPAEIHNTEVLRRTQYVDILFDTFGDNHPLTELIWDCLDNDPSLRPTAEDARKALQVIFTPGPYTNLSRIQIERLLAKRDEQVKMIPQLHSKVDELTVSHFVMLNCELV